MTSPRSLPTSPSELSEREVTSQSNLKVVGALDNYSLVFVIFINFFGQLKDWIGQVLFLVSCLKGQVEKYVSVEAWTGIFCDAHISCFRCRRLPKALKDWQAFIDLKKKIDDFTESCPLLELMANKAMKERHWDRMATLTGHTFDLDSENFMLRDIMKAPLLQYKEDIEVCKEKFQEKYTCKTNWINDMLLLWQF